LHRIVFLCFSDVLPQEFLSGIFCDSSVLSFTDIKYKLLLHNSCILPTAEFYPT